MKNLKKVMFLAVAFSSLIGLLFIAKPSFADLKASNFEFGGYYRVRQIYYHNIATKNSENTSYFIQRFRLDPILNVNEDISIHAQIDMLDNVLWGDNTQVDLGNSVYIGNPSNTSAYYYPSVTTPDGTALLNINLTRAWLEYHSPIGNFSIGRMPFGFGLGVNYNDGDGFKNEWGDAYYGNTADQIQFATMPMGKDGPLVTVLDYAKMKSGNINNPYDDEDWYMFIPGYKTKNYTVFLLLLNIEQNLYKKNINYAELYADLKPTEHLKLLADYFYMSGSLMPFTAGSTGASALQQQLGTSTLTVKDAQGGVLRGIYTQNPLDYVLEIGFSPANGTKPDYIETYPFSNDYNSSLILFNNTGLAGPNSFPNPTISTLSAVGGLNNPQTSIPPQSVLKDDFTYFAPMVKFVPADFFNAKLQLMYAETNDFTNYSPAGLAWLATNRQGPPPAVKLARDLGYEADLGVDFTLSQKFIFGFETGYLIPGHVFDYTNSAGQTKSADGVFAFETRFTVLL